MGTGAAAAPQAIDRMAGALNRFDGSTIRSASAAFGGAAVAAAARDLDVFQDGARLVAVCGRARFADVEFAEMAQHRGLACAIACGYDRRGVDIFPALSGAFALAILDGRAAEALLAIDRMGTHPLCYGEVGTGLVFGSTLDAIRAFPEARTEIDQQGIYDYMYFHMVPAPRTIFTGWRRLLPGTFLRWRGGAVETRPYWEMRYVENERPPLPELKQRFLSVVRESVRESAAAGSVGAFLSGGTDSSTVAGMLGEVTGQPARTFSIGFKAQGYDEMDYARIAARHFGTRHHEYYVTPDDVVSGIPKIAEIHDQPFGNSSAVPAFYCARFARENGVDTLLAGDGGDELFGGNERYATQYVYSLYSDLPRALRKGLIEPLAFLPPEIGILGKVQRYMRTASKPMPARYDNYNLLERLGPEAVFTGEFLATVDRTGPARQMAEVYRNAHAESLINRMLALDLRYTLADSDLPKVSRSCELARVDVRFPLLSDALLAYSARLAPDLKLRRTTLRYFFKEALRGFLPDEIIAKQKHGFGLPFGPWLREHEPLRAIALDSVASLKKRRIVRPEFIDELTTTHIDAHARYYGTMLWILMMLELWFRGHNGARG